MVTRTFLDKSTTIVKDVTCNYGLHPILMLNYGNLVSRFLVHFDVEKIKNLIEDKTYCNTDKLTHKLLMKNCGSVNKMVYKEMVPSPDFYGVRERAVSFTLIAFKVSQSWDEGVGFDNINDFWVTGKKIVSSDGATWYNSTNIEPWGESGIYETKTLRYEYENFKKGLESIIVSEQHFDHGNENLELDVTSYVNDVLNGEENNGLCIAFLPEIEDVGTKLTQYVGFFSNKTNTVFTPVVETRYSEVIEDDRMDLYVGKKNELYLKVKDNLDALPICTIDANGTESEVEVSQVSKGLYKATVELSGLKDRETVCHDIWSGLYYNGDNLDDIEYDFVAKKINLIDKDNDLYTSPLQVKPMVFGINDFEKIKRGEVRDVKVFFKVPYSHFDYKNVQDAYYRIYLKDGDREVNVLDWDRINHINRYYHIKIDTNEFVPTTYYLDIKIKDNDEVKVFNEELTYTIVSNATNEKQ